MDISTRDQWVDGVDACACPQCEEVLSSQLRWHLLQSIAVAGLPNDERKRSGRSGDKNETMVFSGLVFLANTSLWHWKQRKDCQPLNLSVGYWQVSRVYVLAGDYEMGKLFGQKCLQLSQGNKLSPFYIGYAYEALARAEMLHKDTKKAAEYLTEARKELAKITDPEEKKMLEADIASVAGRN